ncbi:Chromosomal replication initiator protein DnaA [Desulfamplus magnetovallimortis]|uniref:Chromosomal replication initiator protein DnaA n=1 Tax=Desulfamplus magnetovallimortis TaxID=1246637 RepID=A0A1W1HC44_9BACT|nr:chromosomal replication initiator protein DnaA [Desulfamplus magnetovallimortis]SLM30019.1 Chromosomal replication initiator protein DnaA [Desulfamplus magnetovallimortis]
MESLWNNVKLKMKDSLPDHSFRMWIQPIEFLASENSVITLLCPNTFSRKRVKDNYIQGIINEFSTLGFADLQIELETPENICHNSSKDSPKGKGGATGDGLSGLKKKFGATTGSSQKGSTSDSLNKGLLLSDAKSSGACLNARKRSSAPKQLTLPGLNLMFDSGRILKKNYTFDQFVVGDNNDFAYSASLSLAQGARNGNSAIYLLAGTGLGKSHLSQAVGHHAMNQGITDKVFYVTAEDFTNEMVYCLKNNTINNFKEKYRRKCDVLILEDVHFLSGKDATQKELAMTLDYLLDAEKRLIFSGCYLPGEIPKMNEQLKSRLTMGLVTKMDAPDFSTRVKILKKKSKEYGCKIPNDVTDYIAQELCDNVRQLESGLAGVAAKASLMGEMLNIDLARSVLQNITKTKQAITVDVIKKLVCSEFGVTEQDLVSPSRKKKHVHPRQLAIYLARKYTDQPLKKIGKSFNRYHATAIYSINAVEKAMKKQGPYSEQLNYLYNKIESGKII